ncbi:MAG: prolipoprotein diacylglyceryl transferase [Nitriliruptoraceae bacterium]
MLIAALPPPPFQGFDIGPLTVHMYGLVIAIGAFLAVQLTVRRYERFTGDGAIAEKTALVALLFGFLGGRIGYVIPRFLWGSNPFIDRPGDILAIWQGGLAFFGGLVGGTVAVVIYTRVKGADLPAMADAFAPALPLAQAIGRWGNWFNQELFGRPTDMPWALRVDPVPASTAARFPGATTFHPTFLYESLWNAGLVVVLLAIDRAGFLRRRGSLIFVYLIGYGTGRGWIEALRVDTVQRYLGLSRNNWIAIAVVLIGGAGLWWWERRAPTTEVDPDADTADSSADPADEAADDAAGHATTEDAVDPAPRDAVPEDDDHSDGGARRGSDGNFG